MVLRGKRALITGGATGIGRAIVESFITAGATVTIAQRRVPDSGLLAHRVNAIAPGWIDTEMSRSYAASTDSAEHQDRLNRLHPAGRTGRPHEIGDAAVFLASDQSSFVTGHTLIVDGGRTVKLPLPS